MFAGCCAPVNGGGFAVTSVSSLSSSLPRPASASFLRSCSMVCGTGMASLRVLTAGKQSRHMQEYALSYGISPPSFTVAKARNQDQVTHRSLRWLLSMLPNASIAAKFCQHLSRTQNYMLSYEFKVRSSSECHNSSKAKFGFTIHRIATRLIHCILLLL